MTAKQKRLPAKAATKAAATFADLFSPTTAALNAKQSRKRASKARQNSLRMRAHLARYRGKRAVAPRRRYSQGVYHDATYDADIHTSNSRRLKRVSNGKSTPAGKTYLVLWCRVFDEGFLRIDQEAAAALKAGYSGERNVTTWREHLRVLKDLGFIDYKAGPAGPCQFVLLLNPYQAVKVLRSKGWVQENTYTALLQRALEIGATDLDEE